MAFTTSGRGITVVGIVPGISVGTYTLGLRVRALVEGEHLRFFGRRKFQKIISDLNDHYIICGLGRIGRIVCEELRADNSNADNVFITPEIDHPASSASSSAGGV